MKSLEESVVTAMDGSEKELFSYLPYILQDLWEIGSDPKVIIELIRRHIHDHSNLSILDLGCGKGAVSIKLAKAFNCTCFGIDAVKEFIDEAHKKAKECGVNHLCQFEIGDIRESIQGLPQFDIIILGSIGPVFGDYYATLTTLSKCLCQNGLLVIDDGYIEDNSDYTHPQVWKKGTILRQIKDAGMQLIDELVSGKDEMKASDDHLLDNIKNRCRELINKYPDKSVLFENYIREQEEENEVLETKVVCSVMLMRKNA